MQILTGKLFKEMVLCGANTLHNNHPEIDAYFIYVNEYNKLDIYYTEGMKKYLKN